MCWRWTTTHLCPRQRCHCHFHLDAINALLFIYDWKTKHRPVQSCEKQSPKTPTQREHVCQRKKQCRAVPNQPDSVIMSPPYYYTYLHGMLILCNNRIIMLKRKRPKESASVWWPKKKEAYTTTSMARAEAPTIYDATKMHKCINSDGYTISVALIHCMQCTQHQQHRWI